MEEKLKWIPFIHEMMETLVERYGNDRKPLRDWMLENIDTQKLKVIKKSDDTYYEDIDPLSILSTSIFYFVNDEIRKPLEQFQTFLGLKNDVPNKFSNWMILGNNGAFIHQNTSKEDIEVIWNLTDAVINDKQVNNLFDKTISITGQKTGVTVCMYYLNPEKYIGMGVALERYCKDNGLQYEKNYDTYDKYLKFCKYLKEQLSGEDLEENNFIELAERLRLYNGADEKKLPTIWIWHDDNKEVCDEILKTGILSFDDHNRHDQMLNCSYDNLHDYGQQPTIGKDYQARHVESAYWQLTHDIEMGDIVVYVYGRWEVKAWGHISSLAQINPEKPIHKYITVDWQEKKDYNSPFPNRSLFFKKASLDKAKQLVDLMGIPVSDNMNLNQESMTTVTESKRDRIKEEFYQYLISCPRSVGKATLLGVPACKTYLKHLDVDVLFDYDPESWKQIESIFDITDIPQLVDIFETLMKNEDFKDNDNRRMRQTALGNYITFLRSAKFFDSQKGTVEKIEVSNIDNIYVKLLRANKNLILTGAPGTGKTYLSKQIASLMNAETEFVQFHPSYDYTDFVEGLRPIKDAEGNVGFERKDGVFKAFCKEALKTYNLKKIDPFEYGYDKLIVAIDEAKKNGSQYMCSTLGADNFPFELTNVKDGIMFQRKNGSTTAKKEDLGKLVHHFLEKGITDVSNSLRSEIESVLGKSADYTNWRGIIQEIFNFWFEVKNLPQAYVLIIDEINRGELSKIFGELFYAIDPGYRGEKGRVKTQFQNLVDSDDVFSEGFYVPENVFILATMNDIDRSVESMDFAMRRRFTWKEIDADSRAEMLDDLSCASEAKKRMTALNNVIASTEGLGKAFQIGPAYFLKLKDLNNNFDELWTMNIETLLKEYLRGFRNADELLHKFKEAYEMDIEEEEPSEENAEQYDKDDEDE